MSRAEANLTTIAGLTAFCILLVVIGWIGDKTGLIDLLGLRVAPAATSKPINRR